MWGATLNIFLMKSQLIILFLCISGFLFAGEVEKSWYIAVQDFFVGPTHLYPTWEEAYCLKTSGDTIIEGKSYRKLLKLESMEDEGAYFGTLRMDSNKIYLRDNKNEWLYYDFNLEVDDSIRIFQGEYPDPEWSTLTVVDSVSHTEVNGATLKEMHVKYLKIGEYDIYPPEEDIWIEGIGSIKNGLLNNSCRGSTGCYKVSYLTCYHEDDVLIWDNPKFSLCWIDPAKQVFPLSEENPKWKTITTLTTYPDSITTKEYEIVKDTRIDFNIYYSKLSNEAGYYRLSGHRVYYKLNADDKEYLLYDFDLEVNETVTCGLNLNNPEAVNEVEFRVEEIDSVKFEDGKHKRLRMKFFPNPESPDDAFYMDWIEGIGSTTHPFYPSISLGAPGSTCELLCYHRDGAKVYQNPGYSNCDVTTGLGHALSDSDDYVIRPFKDVLKIESRNGGISCFLYKIFNTTGKLLKEGETESGMVNISDLPPGVYIISIEGKDGVHVFSDRFVKY